MHTYRSQKSRVILPRLPVRSCPSSDQDPPVASLPLSESQSLGSGSECCVWVPVTSLPSLFLLFSGISAPGLVGHHVIIQQPSCAAVLEPLHRLFPLLQFFQKPTWLALSPSSHLAQMPSLSELILTTLFEIAAWLGAHL